jgi:predicted transport protein
MSDIKLFKVSANSSTEIQGTASNLEKPLQSLIETNLENLLGIRFLATEYSTGKKHGGRIDTLGLDENNCPAIIEYKRSSHENIVSQGLYYLDWLMDHQAEFNLLVQKQIKKSAADLIDWTSPRLLCIAADFSKFDVHAVQQINRSIELIRYRQFGNDLLLLELVNAVEADSKPGKKKTKGAERTGTDTTVSKWLANLTPNLATMHEALDTYIRSLGDDVQRKDLKVYIAFKRLRNFATIVFQKDNLLVYLQLNPNKAPTVQGITRDVREINHWGTGDLELTLSNLSDLEKVKPLIQQAYEGV